MTGVSARLRHAVIGGAAGLALGLAGAAEAAPRHSHRPGPLKIANAQLEPLDWSALEGWRQDDLAEAFKVFQASCRPLAAWSRHRHGIAKHVRPMRKALADVCRVALRLDSPDTPTARAFFESHFRPVRIAPLGHEQGFLTGYYEPLVEGSRFPSEEYDVPVYAKPADLVPLRRHGAGFPNDVKVGRRIGHGKVVPYYDRAQIEDGVLAGRGLEICWVKNPIDAFFMQIQGSARVRLDTGATLRLNYAAHNGLPYTPVGRILIERGEVPREQMSMERIRDWMVAHPVEGKELRRENRSYVFMRATKLADDQQPIGAQGVPLTPLRSIAVDHRLHVYGTPFFISADLPIESEAPVTPFQHLMVAQDTGSAIVGPARADIYFGAGPNCENVAGRIKQHGTFVMLVPRVLDPATAGHGMPIPRPRPRSSNVVASRDGVPVRLTSEPRAIPFPKPRPLATAYSRS